MGHVWCLIAAFARCSCARAPLQCTEPRLQCFAQDMWCRVLLEMVLELSNLSQRKANRGACASALYGRVQLKRVTA